MGSANTAYAGEWNADAQVYGDVAWNLKHQHLFTWPTYDNRWASDYKPSGKYRLALITYSVKHQLARPSWVRKLGT